MSNRAELYEIGVNAAGASDLDCFEWMVQLFQGEEPEGKGEEE